MSPRTLRLLFIASTLMLFVQFALALRVIRPHPALVFPFFAGAPGAEGVLAVEARSLQVSWQDGTQTSLRAEDLLPDLPDYTRTKVATQVFPSSGFRSGSMDAERRDWLHERLVALSDARPASADVQLSLRIHDAEDGRLLDSRQVGVLHVGW